MHVFIAVFLVIVSIIDSKHLLNVLYPSNKHAVGEKQQTSSSMLQHLDKAAAHSQYSRTSTVGDAAAKVTGVDLLRQTKQTLNSYANMRPAASAEPNSFRPVSNLSQAVRAIKHQALGAVSLNITNTCNCTSFLLRSCKHI